MLFDQELLTADDAKLMLMDNPVNRRLSQPAIKRFAREMLEDRWGNNPQPIMISPTGRLIDGQHRLHALILADEQHPGIAVTMTVVRDVPETVFDVVDQGQPRSAAQTLATIHGIPNSTTIAAAAQLVIRYERFPNQIWAPGNASPKSEVIVFVLKFQDELALLDHTHRYRQARLVAATAQALQWLIIRHSRCSEKWEDFIEGVTEGAGLSVGDPRLTLRNRIAGTSESWGNGQGRLGIYIKAWNGFAEDREVKLLRFSRGELPMPVIQ